MKSAFFFLFQFLFMLASAQPVNSIDLSGTWQFRKSGSGEWLPAKVPGTVHQDLLALNKIPDPYIDTNERAVQWIENEDWEYKNEFNADAIYLSQKNIELVMDGLDTYADVFLNDSLILKADNMFRQWRVDVKPYLRSGKNELRFYFYSAVRRGRDMASKLPYTLPGDEKVFTRKAAYQYGWDWGPRLVTCGIWRSIRLEAWSLIRLDHYAIQTDSLKGDKAFLRLQVDVNSGVDGTMLIMLQNEEQGDSSRIYRQFLLHKGLNELSLSFSVNHPQLWWSKGSGEPHLTPFLVEGSMSDELFISKELKVGIRTLELIQVKDVFGTGFYFRLNERPVYMKGANFIPPDNFLPRITDQDYAKLIDHAVKVNMNMLRVWGGGTYERDRFYDLCDENGIMIWQDMMFACAMYPGDKAFLENVKQELNDNLLRLRSHPCIALYCGNNEIDEGWHNWGWQKQYHYDSTTERSIWKDYRSLFHELIPSQIHKAGINLAYLQSSPVIGWGHKESMQQGDSHYWGVWWGNEVLQTYEQKVPRFMSEFGFQAMPDPLTVKQMGGAADADINSPSMQQHQKHPTGYGTISHYMERLCKEPKGLLYNYASQVLQADGIGMAIEAQRRSMPRCMGTLYWQLNDCWPVVSWSSMDRNGNWKALHYRLQHLYATQLVSIAFENKRIVCYAVNDDQPGIPSVFKLSLHNSSGKQIWQKDTTYLMPGSVSRPVFNVDSSVNFAGKDVKDLFLQFRWYKGDTLICEDRRAFKDFAEVNLVDPQLNLEYVDAHHVRLRCRRPAWYIALSKEDSFSGFSDNFFNLMPDQGKLIRIEQDILPGDIRYLRAFSLFNLRN